jgi:hypothetical protein
MKLDSTSYPVFYNPRPGKPGKRIIDSYGDGFLKTHGSLDEAKILK